MVEKEVRFFEIPTEIRNFFGEVFELYEIRERIGQLSQIKFYIYGEDHNPPHIHAIYNEYKISISLKDFSVKGNLPGKNNAIAQKWVKDNKDLLLKKWNNMVITSNLPLTKSKLEIKETVNN